MNDSIAVCPVIPPPPLSRKILNSISSYLFFKRIDLGTDIKCQLIFHCQKENHSFKGTETKGQMPLIKLLDFLFWFEKVWHFKQPFLFHSLLLACMACLFQMPVIDIKYKMRNDLNRASPQLCAPSLVSSYHLLHTGLKIQNRGEPFRKLALGPSSHFHNCILYTSYFPIINF